MSSLENKIRRAFDQIEAGDALKSAAARAMRAERERGVRRGGWARPLAAVCAVLALVLAGGGGLLALRTPVSYVSIDVNPSLELALNRFDRVVSATAYNEDARRVLETVKVRWLPCTQAVETLLDSAAMAPYLTQTSELTLTVASGDAARESALLSDVAAGALYQAHGGQCYSADVDDLDEAHRHGMSLGKYAAWQTLAQYDDTVTEEDCRDMTMGEIHERIHACENGESGHHGGAGDAAPQATPDPAPGAAGASGSGHHGGHHGGHE